jgi:hypothetical protein
MNLVSSVPLPNSFSSFFTKHRLHLILVFVVAFLFVGISYLLHARIGFQPSVTLGCILSVTNAFLGYVFIERAFRYDSSVFFFIAFSGMALRFFLMIAAVALVLMTGMIETASFIASFMAFYVTCMTVEVIHINRKIDEQRLAKAFVKR